jgi:hypothetical protein
MGKDEKTTKKRHKCVCSNVRCVVPQTQYSPTIWALVLVTITSRGIFRRERNTPVCHNYTRFQMR